MQNNFAFFHQPEVGFIKREKTTWKKKFHEETKKKNKQEDTKICD